MTYLLKEKFQQKQIILASGSPRRKELLAGLDLPFIIQTKEVEEIYPNDLKRKDITEYLAKLKSDAFTNLDSNTIIITADTIVWHNGKAVMKPKNRGEAHKMIEALSNTWHEVYTSVCIKSKSKQVLFSDKTIVHFEKLTSDEIAYYVATYKPFDKAGAYGAQDWIGYIGINKLEGSYFNVMGLPVHRLYKELLKF